MEQEGGGEVEEEKVEAEAERKKVGHCRCAFEGCVFSPASSSLNASLCFILTHASHMMFTLTWGSQQ